MKRYIFICLALMWGASKSYSQDITDALRYASDELTGTARFTAMGGAFGALGGDISSLKVNPAGSSVFLNNFASFSLSNETYTNDVEFGNGFQSKKNNHVDLHQGGVVFVFNNYNENATVSKFAFGFTYDRTNSFYDKYIAEGTTNNSIGDYFVNLANGVPLDLFTPRAGESLDDLYTYLGESNFPGYNNTDLQTAYLGYETYLFEAADDSDLGNSSYISNVTGNNFNQRYNYTSKGLNGKLSANGSLALKDKIYLGLNLNSHFINYEKTTVFFEQIASPSDINEIYFENNLETFGSGFSFDLGAIAKLSDMLRVGVSYESPTWYTISEETTQYLDTYSNDNAYVVADPRVVNVYPDYELRTPGKITGSLGLVFGSNGLISFDYSYKDYSNTEFSSEFSDVYFDFQNSSIEDNLEAASTYRVGGEYRLMNWSLRGGFRYVESPYQNNDIMSELIGYSAGLGYNFGNLRLDLAYDLSQQDYNTTLNQTGLSNTAYIDRSRSNYVVTLGFGF